LKLNNSNLTALRKAGLPGTSSLAFGLWEEVPQETEHGLCYFTLHFTLRKQVPRLAGMLLLPGSGGALQPLAHLLEGNRINLATCVALTQYL
jgi:hypothetical protein